MHLQTHCSPHCCSVAASVQGWPRRERHNNEEGRNKPRHPRRQNFNRDSGEQSATHCSARAAEGAVMPR